MRLTRIETIALIIGSNVAFLFAALGFLNVPVGAMPGQRIEGLMLPLMLFGVLSMVIVELHVFRWGVEQIRRGLTRQPGGNRA